jgi:hypothetical protein
MCCSTPQCCEIFGATIAGETRDLAAGEAGDKGRLKPV